MKLTDEQKRKVLDCFEHQRHAPFSWPDDGLCGEPWHYDFHVGWVKAWNAEGRQTPAEKFICDFYGITPPPPSGDGRGKI